MPLFKDTLNVIPQDSGGAYNPTTRVWAPGTDVDPSSTWKVDWQPKPNSFMRMGREGKNDIEYDGEIWFKNRDRLKALAAIALDQLVEVVGVGQARVVYLGNFDGHIKVKRMSS
jgi:hypothetical protein